MQKTDRLNHQAIPLIYLDSSDGMWREYVPYSREILTAKNALPDETVFPLGISIQSEYGPTKEGSESDEKFNALKNCLDVSFPVSVRSEMFDNNVQPDLPDHVNQ